MIKIKGFLFNLFNENTFVVYDEDTKECMIVDPGCSNEQEEKILSRFIEEKKLKVKYLLNTHCHIDHILGVKFIKDKYQPEYFIPEKDLQLMERSAEQAQLYDLKLKKPPLPDGFLTEDTKLNLGASGMKFIHTPGHTEGEYCIYFPNDNFCITGDVLFHAGIGRTDLWGGDFDTLMNSIKEKLFSLPDETTIYPGHGKTSTIGEEKESNPSLV